MGTVHIKAMGSTTPSWINNLSLQATTTTDTNDSIKITGYDGTALSASNPGYVTLPTSTVGQVAGFQVTADVTIKLTGAHWGMGTYGDITGAILRVFAINDNGTLRFGVALLGGRDTLLTTDTNATATNINLPEEVLCTAAVSSATNFCREIGFFRADFDDTGGASEDLWAIQTGVGDIVTGQTGDGHFMPWKPSYTGFSVNPSVAAGRWAGYGRAGVVDLSDQNSGTSDATTLTITNAPFTPRGSYSFPCQGIDNGASITTPCRAGFGGDRTITFRSDYAAGAWTNSGNKRVEKGLFFMEFGPSASFIE